MAVLQQFYRNAVWRFDKGHVSVTRWTVNGVSCFLDSRAGLIDILDAVSQMTEIAADGVRFGRSVFVRPVIRQLHLGHAFVPRCRQEDQGKAPLLTGKAAHLLNPNKVEKGNGGIRVRDADHAVEKAGHRASANTPTFNRKGPPRFCAAGPVSAIRLRLESELDRADNGIV